MSTALVTGQENIQLAVVSGASTNIEVNDLALISDCEKATLFKVTSVAVNGVAMTLGHAVSAANGNIVDGLAETGTFGTDAAVASIVSKTYFIKQGASGIAGRGGYSLFQFDGAASANWSRASRIFKSCLALTPIPMAFPTSTCSQRVG